MDAFTLDWGRSWVVRILGRSQLVRPTDRLETVVVALSVVFMIVAIPVVAALGISVNETRSATYAEQAVIRRETTATAVADARLHLRPNSQSFDVTARWSAEHILHTGTVVVPELVRAGDRFDVWIDADGNYADAPPPPDRAATESVGGAVLAWIGLAMATALGVHAIRRRLDRIRYAAWDRELASLAGNDDGRAGLEP